MVERYRMKNSPNREAELISPIRCEQIPSVVKGSYRFNLLIIVW